MCRVAGDNAAQAQLFREQTMINLIDQSDNQTARVTSMSEITLPRELNFSMHSGLEFANGHAIFGHTEFQPGLAIDIF